jgi:folate-binding protein YgfZ
MMTEAASFEQQYDALRSGCGLVELAGWSSVTISGRDRQTFLHNFCTNDVKRLVPGTSCEAFVTDVRGKTIGHVLITCRDDELVLVGTPGQAPGLVAHFDRYVIREDVVLRDTTSELAYIAVGGNATLDTLARLDSNMHDGGSFAHRSDNFDATLAGVAVRVIAWHWLGKCKNSRLACLLEMASGNTRELTQAITAAGAVACDEAAFTAMRIEAGLPVFGVDFDDRNLPQEIGRDERAISLTKGCYLGQETVARIDALGHVNQQLVGVQFSDPRVPSAGTELSFSGKKVGQVRSATLSPQLGSPLALAMIRREWTAPGSRLESPVGACQVVSLPLEVGDR